MKSLTAILISAFLASVMWTVPVSSKKLIKVKIRVVTWNVERQARPVELDELVGYDPKNESNSPMFVLLGLQAKDLLHRDHKWGSLEKTLEWRGYRGIKFHVRGNMGYHLLVRDYDRYIRQIHAGYYTWPIGNATVTSHKWYDNKITIINSHLKLNGSCPSKLQEFYKNASKEFRHGKSDLLFWVGEMNCMVNEDPQEAHKLIKQKKLKELLTKDSLTIALNDRKSFPGWKEQEIMFRPTYKLLPNSRKYDLSVTPSWKDRILFKTDTREKIGLVKYKRLDNYNKTQHRPVIAEFMFLLF